jgi:fumarylacetoacetase
LQPVGGEDNHPSPLPYLTSANNSADGAVDMPLEVFIQAQKMKSAAIPTEKLPTSNFTDAYRTTAQILANHTVNGCNMRAGDFFGSGTMSGSTPNSQAALMEITRGGTEPVRLSNGETRTLLEDGDTIIMRARCERDGAAAIGFGECSGTVSPATSQ